MRRRMLTPLAALAFVLAACGGSASGPTQAAGSAGAGGGTPTGGAQPTDAPPATQSGGGGGGGGGGNTGSGTGRIRMEIGGPVQVTVDQPFFAIGSRFGGEAGTSLNFTSDGADGIASIGVVNDGVVIGWASEALVASSGECKLSGWTIGATSGSGSFDCTGGVATKADGTYLAGVTMKGSFEAGL